MADLGLAALDEELAHAVLAVEERSPKLHALLEVLQNLRRAASKRISAMEHGIRSVYDEHCQRVSTDYWYALIRFGAARKQMKFFRCW